MSTDNQIATLDVEGLLSQGEFEWGFRSQTGIVLKDEIPEAEWLRLTEQTLHLYEGHGKSFARAALYVADLLNFGEEKFGERYAQAIDGTRDFMNRQESTIANWRWIARAISPARRRENLSLAHHETVAKLQPDEQDEFLRLADNEALSVKALKEKVKERHPGKVRTTAKATVTVKIDTDKEGAVKDALTIITDWHVANEAELTKAQFDAVKPLYDLYRRELKRRSKGKGAE